MENPRDLNTNEMKLLQQLGNDPGLTNKKLARLLGLKTSSYVSTLKTSLEERGYSVGPYYQIDYGRLFSNRMRKAIAIILFEQSYQYIFSLLKNIECFSYLYPVEERFFRSYMAGIFDSNTEAIKRIFDFLKQKGVIFHYELYLQDYQTYVICPTFLVDCQRATFVPPLNNLLDDTTVPDLSFGEWEAVPLSPPEQALITYFEQGASLLTSAMEKEGEKGNFFTYAEWKAAKERLMSRKIMQPVYDIFPLPSEECSHFFLFLHGETPSHTKKMLFNFGKNSRLFKKIFLWTSFSTRKTYGVMYCIAHPDFTIRLLTQLDNYKEIEDKKFFIMRQKPSAWEGKSISLKDYDPDTGTLYYPYEAYFEKVKTFVEENPW